MKNKQVITKDSFKSKSEAFLFIVGKVSNLLVNMKKDMGEFVDLKNNTINFAGALRKSSFSTAPAYKNYQRIRPIINRLCRMFELDKNDVWQFGAVLAHKEFNK